MSQIRVYIDGFNLYHAIDKIGDYRLKWLNFSVLSRDLLREGETLDEVHFFTAVWPYDSQKQKRHRNFIAAQKACGVFVHEGKFSKPKRWCERHQRSCPFREEKQTDVGLAIKIVSDAQAGAVNRIILITADSDQIPTAKLVNAMDGVSLTLAFPPGRSQEARELGDLIPDRFELKPQRLKHYMLPRSVVVDGTTVATMPALYLDHPADASPSG